MVEYINKHEIIMLILKGILYSGVLLVALCIFFYVIIPGTSYILGGPWKYKPQEEYKYSDKELWTPPSHWTVSLKQAKEDWKVKES